MTKVRIVTDSTADLDEGEIERLGITVVPLNVHWNGDTYQDKVELSVDEFYRRLREEKGTPRTSQPSAGQFESAYRGLLADAEGILSIHISSKLSGTINSAQLAAQQVGTGRIVVIDSLFTAFALGFLVERAARLAQEGASLAECAALVQGLIPRIRLVAAVDTLEFLRRGGRIGRAQAFAGNLLSIKLIFSIQEGEVVPLDRVRTRAGAIKRTAEAVRAWGAVEELAVLYGDDPAPAEELVGQLRAAQHGLTARRGRIGPVLGTHTGPGVFGVCAVLPPE
ncbi:MAG: DegV family protein [Sphingomonadaceae bacterium]